MDPQEQSQPPAAPTPPEATPMPTTESAPNPASSSMPSAPSPVGATGQPTVAGESDKDYLVAWLLAYFLGVFGADRFYMGEVGLGILKLVTLGGCGIWALVDWIMIMAGARKDKQGRPLANRQKNLKTSIIILVISVGLSVVLNIVSFAIQAGSSGSTPGY